MISLARSGSRGTARIGVNVSPSSGMPAEVLVPNGNFPKNFGGVWRPIRRNGRDTSEWLPIALRYATRVDLPPRDRVAGFGDGAQNGRREDCAGADGVHRQD